MKQYNEFVNIQEQINKINKIIEDKEHNIKDIETKIHDIEKKINNINNERAEETFLKNIRTKH
jgi:predicted  nucleic acid-binding Zn-ribbon protein